MAMVLVFQHNEHIPPGLLGEALERRRIDMTVVHLHAGDPVPDHYEFDGVASLGGVMGAYEVEEHPWLLDEMRFLAGVEERAIAHALGVSTRTVRRQWRMARAFLKCELSGDDLS